MAAQAALIVTDLIVTGALQIASSMASSADAKEMIGELRKIKNIVKDGFNGLDPRTEFGEDAKGTFLALAEQGNLSAGSA